MLSEAVPSQPPVQERSVVVSCKSRAGAELTVKDTNVSQPVCVSVMSTVQSPAHRPVTAWEPSPVGDPGPHS